MHNFKLNMGNQVSFDVLTFRTIDSSVTGKNLTKREMAHTTDDGQENYPYMDLFARFIPPSTYDDTLELQWSR